MAINSILRRSASSLRPLAAYLLRTHRNYHPLLCTAINRATLSRNPSMNTFVPSFHFSSAELKKFPSDDNLLRAIESEIRYAEETDDHHRVEGVPSDFPFEIVDSPGQHIIILKRKYQGEDIKIEVHMPDLVTGENEDNRGDDDSENPSQSCVPLVVSVSKNGGPFLDFSCMAYPDEIVIDSMSVKNPENAEDQIAYEGPDFQDLDDNLQKAFHKYLEIRGIKPRTVNFLHEFMINKDSREYLVWMKKLKKFIEA